MKIPHKINFGWTPPDHPNAIWSERVEREAARHTDAAEHAYRKAQERLLRAQQAVWAEETQQKPKSSKRLARLRRIVEDRREELARLDCLRRQTVAGSQHRGRKSYRGVPGAGASTGNPL
jgi:acyl-CoA reductase-like NAD-dependent aldehyde dehydrogenase